MINNETAKGRLMSSDNPYGLTRDRRTKAELLEVIIGKDKMIRDLSKKSDAFKEDLQEEKEWREVDKRELERDIEIVFAELDATREVLFYTIQSISRPEIRYKRKGDEG